MVPHCFRHSLAAHQTSLLLRFCCPPRPTSSLLLLDEVNVIYWAQARGLYVEEDDDGAPGGRFIIFQFIGKVFIRIRWMAGWSLTEQALSIHQRGEGGNYQTIQISSALLPLFWLK